MSEYLEPWIPVEGIPNEFLTASVTHGYNRNLTVRLHRGYSNEALTKLIGPDLVIEFGPTPAFMVHEEFSHPRNDTLSLLSKETRGKPDYPCLIVRNSQWLATFSEQRLIGWDGCVHYLFITGFPIIDVLSNATPKVSWQTPI